ncbi:subclass B3 metallo-beta-lactamase [Mucilaginibacter sp. MD40]|uniref:subclass B3 metallo-beta-lactamase n=1 Tax=Mucilaginibacter sp. MD40 TaxID=2029590 RepID=UPI000BACD27D|nr:subclass B3 metallo-beta-lactamase [Mucilaginibacter sp. MD40]PAW92101.1 subclass B3 metallo-beta-lactamase [Mucilaginibacter sp. MD40]
MKKVLSILLLVLIAACVQAQIVREPDATKYPDWTRSIAPFRVVGNLYYVGTADLACYLITTKEGHILINTGLASSENIILENIKKLGFKVSDVKILLTTQAHFDHLGAMAAIKKITGAKMLADYADASVIADGGLSDYDLDGKHRTFKPIHVDRILHNDDHITLGNMALTMLYHPGHTKGSCSYLFNVTDKGRTYRVLIANMPTIVTDKDFNAIPAYPKIAKDYAYTLAAMQKLKFDIWLASHGSQFDLLKKYPAAKNYRPSVFMDKENYYQQLKELEIGYRKKLAGRRS